MENKKSVCDATSRRIPRIKKDAEDHADAKDYGRFRGFSRITQDVEDHEIAKI